MNFLNITVNNALCLKNGFDAGWDPYFASHYHRYNSINGTVLTINLISLLAGTLFCGMNLCCPCSCAKPENRERSPYIPVPEQDEEEVPLVNDLPVRPAPKVTSKVKTCARILGAVALCGAQIGMACWGLSWFDSYAKSSPLQYVTNLLLSSYKNCTG